MSLHLSLSLFRINTFNPWVAKSWTQLIDWTTTTQHTYTFHNRKGILEIKIIFFHSQHFFFFATIYRENWSNLSKLLHRPQAGEASWARVFLNTGNSWMYSWVQSTKGYQIRGFAGGSSDKEPICQCRRCSFDPWVGKNPWRREWQPILVCLLGESHGHRSLEGYSPLDHIESDMTEAA